MIARIFIRKTNLTPEDECAIVNRGPGLLDGCFKEAHISVLFSYDMERAKQLAEQWSKCCNVRIGGPGTGERGSDFEPGMYVKKGAVITSRGCPNRCWFCSVWRREGPEIRELPIRIGHNILDDNLLRCSDDHVNSVFKMLDTQNEAASFTGGLEAAAMKDFHIDLLTRLKRKPKQIFFAYDTEDDADPLRESGKKMMDAGFTRHHLRSYCLIGFPGDTFEKAEKRLKNCVQFGFFPMDMLYRNEAGEEKREWKIFQREWSRPAIIYAKTYAKTKK